MILNVAAATQSVSETNNEDRIRVEQIFQAEIEYIESDEFEKMYSEEFFPKSFEVSPVKQAKKGRVTGHVANLACLAPALNEPLLSFDEEQHEFRRMNFLKYSAARLRASLNPQRPSIKKMEQIERLLAEVKQVRDHIVRANLRLVIANSSKCCTAQYVFEDLVSDGSLALMEAVDKFDYQRGFRFSTYATHAIRRSFFRKIERRQKDRQRFSVTDPDVMTSTPDNAEVDHDAPAQRRLMEHLVNSLSQYLTERELHIIEARFGLNGRTEPQTLVQLSGELGICKERVRQVEGSALQKLHAVALEYGHLRTEVLSPV